MKNTFLFYFLVFSILSFAQERVISGVIKDFTTKKVVAGVSISIVGSNAGTVSNEEGGFKIAVPEGYSKINFSHVSYDLKEYEVDDNTVVKPVTQVADKPPVMFG